jgi:hypothetical protein
MDYQHSSKPCPLAVTQQDMNSQTAIKLLILSCLTFNACKNDISDNDKYAISHIVFKDSLNTIKTNTIELELLMLKMSKNGGKAASYLIEKLEVRHNIFTFDTTEYGDLQKLSTINEFRNLTDSETTRFFSLIKFFDSNGLNGMTVDNGAVMFHYYDSITMPTNWTERTLILKRKNNSTQNWIDINSKIDETNDFVLLDEP